MNIEQVSQQLKQAGLHQRSSQLQMIEKVYQALAKQQVICLEAPTGTGKTIAYAIAAYLNKMDNYEKQTIVISTATVTLQEQLYQKDLPLLSAVLNKPIRSALAKGRRRYVCHARLFNDDFQVDMLTGLAYQQTLREQLDKGLWNGDRDQLDLPITETQWMQVSTDSAGCTGKLCAYYKECAFYRARQQWQQSDFVITNHSLLLSDLALGGGVLLPKPEKSVYILDECHHLPDRALNHFAKSAPLMSSVDWINQMTIAINKAVQVKLIAESTQKLIQAITHSLIQTLQAMHDFLNQNKSLFEQTFGDQGKLWRCMDSDESVFMLANPIQSASAKLLSECVQFTNELTEKLQSTQPDTEDKQRLTKLIAQFGFFQTRIDNLYQTWQLFCERQDKKSPPIARWFVQRDNQQFYCHASPINVSEPLKKLFWDSLTNGALLCSATIRALGNFDDYTRKVGLKNYPNLTTTALDSCFDYEKSILFIPSMKAAPQGSAQSAHREEVIELLPHIISMHAGTLVLFTSRTAMETTHARMPHDLKSDILMQGAIGKSKLLESHKNQIASGKRSILFGLSSFGEGLDLPANLCQHVIIHKLPFAVPTTPIELTRREWLEKNNLNPFSLATLPDTSIRLAQYVGRLIRKESDHGIVTILDNRLYNKSYGKQLLKNLPKFKQLLNCSVQTLKKEACVSDLF